MDHNSVTILKSQLFASGGLEKYTWHIAKAFCEKGAPVTLLTTGKIIPPFQNSKLNIVDFPIQYPMSVLNVRSFDDACQRYLGQHPASIVFGLDRNRFQTHIRAGNGVHAAYLEHRAKQEGRWKELSFSLNPLHRILLKLEKAAFEDPRLQVLFTNSYMVREEALSFYNIDPKKIQVVHNGVEWSEWQEHFDHWSTDRIAIMNELRLDPHCFQFLFIGHNYKRKGLDLLLKALSLLPNRHFQLSVIGKEKNLSYFQELAAKYHLTEKVRFFGSRKDSHRFYQLADALLIPSLYDPFANVTVEALAMGLYVVSSKTNGAHEVLEEESGYVIDSLSDPYSIAYALEEALKRPKTIQSAALIRNCIRHLDFPNQLKQIINRCF